AVAVLVHVGVQLGRDAVLGERGGAVVLADLAAVEQGDTHAGGLALTRRQLALVVGGVDHRADPWRHLRSQRPDARLLAAFAVGDVDAGQGHSSSMRATPVRGRRGVRMTSMSGGRPSISTAPSRTVTDTRAPASGMRSTFR